MMKGMMLSAVAALALLGSGCTNTVRFMTATRWINAATTGGASTGEDGRTLYVTFWEGTCSSGILGFGKGCSIGDSKIRRCNVKTDNAMECVEEMEATKAFERKK